MITKGVNIYSTNILVQSTLKQVYTEPHSGGIVVESRTSDSQKVHSTDIMALQHCETNN